MSSARSTAVPQAAERSRTTWVDYWQLTKPTVTFLVVFTTACALVLGAAGFPRWEIVVAALAGTWLASASAGAFNHVLDSDIDVTMARTRHRPLPNARIQGWSAFLFASFLGLLSATILYVAVNPLTAWVALAANAFYVLVYTAFLKRRTPQNIVIGGAAGAVGPLIGWAAATGELSLQAWLMFGIIFLWTPPHFWALALKYKDDYARANVPMMPVVKGEDSTRLQILLYSLTLFPAVFALYWWSSLSVVYLGLSLLATGHFVLSCWKLYREKTVPVAMKTFWISCYYLFVIFAIIAADSLVQSQL